MSQVPEASYTLANFRNTFRERYKFTNVTVLGSDANGTHFFYDDALGERHFGVISDLVEARIVRTGTLSLTIPANGLSVAGNATISPELPNTDDFRAWANERLATAAYLQASCSVRISSTTNLQVRANRLPLPSSFFIGSTVLTHSIETVDVIATNPHAHATDLALGQLHLDAVGTDVDTHTHTITYGQAAAAVVVDWWISSLAE